MNICEWVECWTARCHGNRFSGKLQWSVSKDWHTPGPKPRFAILCRNWSSLWRTASLLQKTTSQPFRGASGKWYHTRLKLLGNFWKTRCSDIDYNALFNTNTYPFLNVLKKRKDSWPGFQFIQLPGINGFPFFLPRGLAKRHFSGCQTLQWSQRLRQTGCLYAWNTVAVYWNYDLQHKSFKISLLRPVWICPAVNL